MQELRLKYQTKLSLNFRQQGANEEAKNYVMDENQQAIAVQIPIADLEKIEQILGNYGLVKLMEESEDEEPLSKDKA